MDAQRESDRQRHGERRRGVPAHIAVTPGPPGCEAPARQRGGRPPHEDSGTEGMHRGALSPPSRGGPQVSRGSYGRRHMNSSPIGGRKNQDSIRRAGEGDGLPTGRSVGAYVGPILPMEMAPRAGFEPATNRLTAGCSTAELPRNTARTGCLARPPANRKPKLTAAEWPAFSPQTPLSHGARKKRPGVSPAPRRWVMVGCLQGKTAELCARRVNKSLMCPIVGQVPATART